MGANLVGADLEALIELEKHIERQAIALVTLTNAASGGVSATQFAVTFAEGSAPLLTVLNRFWL